jgi:hypothetical protein
MEADWEIEIGGGAAAIEALWAGFVDLRGEPARIAEIAEAAGFPPLARLLLALNRPPSPLWTAKCDLWEPAAEELGRSNAAPPAAEAAQEFALACYIDLLPFFGKVFAQWQHAESFCRSWVARLDSVAAPHAALELVVRQAIAGAVEGFGVTAYLSARGRDRAASAAALAASMEALAATIPPLLSAETV